MYDINLKLLVSFRLMFEEYIIGNCYPFQSVCVDYVIV